MPVGVQPGGVAVLQTPGGQFVYYLVSYKNVHTCKIHMHNCFTLEV